jgi:hypothetical protein
MAEPSNPRKLMSIMIPDAKLSENPSTSLLGLRDKATKPPSAVPSPARKLRSKGFMV